jgi:hypothetical protein
MFTRIALLTTVAVFASTATIAAAAGKTKPVKVKPYSGPLLSVTPAKGKPNAPLTITGTRFAPSRKLHAEIDCPAFGHARNGSWSYSVKTNTRGSFTLTQRFPKLKGTNSGICNVYVLNTTRTSAFWISTGFRVT